MALLNIIGGVIVANEKILAKKQEVIDEIKDRVYNSSSVILFDYRGITDKEAKELRKKLKENDADYKVYKNTLMARALSDLKIDINDQLVGPSAMAFGTDQIGAVKVLSDFAKKNQALVLKVGIIDGEVSDKEKLDKLASIPSREGLLTMLAGGMIGIARDLSICLNLYAEQKEENYQTYIINTTDSSKFKIFDFGGREEERSKWETVYDQVKAVIFVFALSDFDIKDSNGNLKLQTATELFNQLTHHPDFERIPFYLILNKFDIFSAKIKNHNENLIEKVL